MTLEQVQELAFKAAGSKKPTKKLMDSLPTGDAALYKFWKENKHVGIPYSTEYDIDGGGKALITAAGYVIYWDTQTTQAV